ncbi:hypothetical protein M758_2G208400 [Ceratodon purpureus]|nr:hypothetical protein M758_2G208400 [Ceratodon purpureus]
MPGGDEMPFEKLEIKVKEPTLVFPAEPTRKHAYFLTNLDQNIAVSMRTVYIFNAQEDKKNEDPVAVIKEALSKLLVHFYPMCGRLGISEDGKLQVECEDQGALFVEATADNCIAELGELSSPAPFMRQLVHDVANAKNILEVPPLIVQVTTFKCGGFVLGVHNNHCLMDGLSANEFLLAWGDLARGVGITNPPHIDRSVLRARDPPRIEFPHHEFDEIEDLSPEGNLLMDDSLVYSNFILTPQAVEALKRTILEDGTVSKVSTFEALTALTWRARTQALEMPPEQKTRLLFAVDGRNKFNPPIPRYFFGNGIVLTTAITTAGELTQHPLSYAVKLVQGAIAMISDGYMRSALDFFEVTRARPALVATLLVTTWLRLPFHTVDFGWGQPLCTSPACLPDREVVLFTSCGKDRRSVNILLGMPSLASMVKVNDHFNVYNQAL